MARPHIEFIQAQLLPWQRGLYGGARPEIDMRILSLDEGNGSSTLMLRYPAGWARPQPEHLTADEEFFVLDGAIEINGQVYDRHCYGHHPAGFVRHSSYCGGGAVVLAYFSAEPKAIRGLPFFGMRWPDRLVRFIDTKRMQGSERGRAEMFPGIKTSGSLHKRLKTDPVTGEVTWLVLIRGGSVMTQKETHPVIEEEFSLSGDQVGPLGNMRPGAYFWRPAGIQHGPFGSATGTIHLVRGIGGRYTTVLEDTPEPFAWDAPYRPVLPPAYRRYVEGYGDRETNY
ncbi:MAG: DUF4437 domain-containing protein [Alphaproteobacteria bacterium]|nr:DUF4437 domain-containing protein [Alphaproteobacteria bacterium]